MPQPFIDAQQLEALATMACHRGRQLCLAGARVACCPERDRFDDKQIVCFYPEREMHPVDISPPFGSMDLVVTMSQFVVDTFQVEDIFVAYNGEVLPLCDAVDMEKWGKLLTPGELWSVTWGRP